MVTLREVLTEKEIRRITYITNYHDISIDRNLLNLTVKDLHLIAFDLIETKYDVNVPDCFLSAEAINILFRRAVKLNLSIFD